MDLISLPIESDRKKIDSRYRLVIAAAQRAKQLAGGARPKVSTKAKKVTTIAIEELLSGSVNILAGGAAQQAKEKAKKLIYEGMIDEAKQKTTLPEDLTELEKDLKVYLSEKEVSQRALEDIFREEG